MPGGRQVLFPIPRSGSLDEQVFHPHLGSIFHADHFSAEPVVRGQCAEGAGQNQVGLERFSGFEGGHPRRASVKTESWARTETSAGWAALSRAMVSSATMEPRWLGTPIRWRRAKSPASAGSRRPGTVGRTRRRSGIRACKWSGCTLPAPAVPAMTTRTWERCRR